MEVHRGVLVAPASSTVRAVGGVFSKNGHLTTFNATIADNVATSTDKGAFGGGVRVFGGGMYNFFGGMKIHVAS